MGEERDEQDHAFDGDEKMKHADEVIDAEEPVPCQCPQASNANRRPKTGAVCCALLSLAMVLTFFILVSAVLLMPSSDVHHVPLVNVSYVDFNASGANDDIAKTGDPLSSTFTSAASQSQEHVPASVTNAEGGKTSTAAHKEPTIGGEDATKATPTKSGGDHGQEQGKTYDASTKGQSKKPDDGKENTEKVKVTMPSSTTTLESQEEITNTEPTGPTVQPMPYNSLICTLSGNMSQRQVSELPEDGLCDFSFYQAYEKDHVILKGIGGPFATSLLLVFEAAAQHKKTEYGFSFDYSCRDAAEKVLAEEVASKTLGEMWKKKIYHYAYLLLAHDRLGMNEYRKVFHNLQKVKDILHKGVEPQRPSYFLIGEAFYNKIWMNLGFNNIRERMHVHGVVVYGHIVADDRSIGQILPPSFWNSTAIDTKAYMYNLRTAHWALRELPRKKLGYTQFFLSVSLGGRYYTPTKGEQHTFLSRNGYLVDEQFLIDIGQVCKSQDWVWAFRNDTPIGNYYDNDKIDRVVTYDDEMSFRPKLCKGKMLNFKEKYGIAAYDADLDDPHNVCGKGAYSRLRFLKRLLHFFNEKFLEKSDYDECLKLQ